MDFFTIKTRTTKKGHIDIYPDFIVRRSNDLMVRGGAFYAIWDDERKIWSTDEYDVCRLVDRELDRFASEQSKIYTDDIITVKHLASFSSGMWNDFKK